MYPQSGNAHDSYAEALSALGCTDEAIKNCKRSLELDSTNQNAARMIEMLQNRDTK